MLFLSDSNQTDIIVAFNTTSRYLDDLLNIDNPYFEQMVGQIYPTELQLIKANSSGTEAPFFDLNLSITNGIVSSKIYGKRDYFNFEIVNFPFLDGDVPQLQFPTSIKGHNSVLNCLNLPICNPRTPLPNINSHSKFEENWLKNAPSRE